MYWLYVIYTDTFPSSRLCYSWPPLSGESNECNVLYFSRTKSEMYHTESHFLQNTFLFHKLIPLHTNSRNLENVFWCIWVQMVKMISVFTSLFSHNTILESIPGHLGSIPFTSFCIHVQVKWFLSAGICGQFSNGISLIINSTKVALTGWVHFSYLRKRNGRNLANSFLA